MPHELVGETTAHTGEEHAELRELEELAVPLPDDVGQVVGGGLAPLPIAEGVVAEAAGELHADLRFVVGVDRPVRAVVLLLQVLPSAAPLEVRALEHAEGRPAVDADRLRHRAVQDRYLQESNKAEAAVATEPRVVHSVSSSSSSSDGFGGSIIPFVIAEH